MAAKKFPSRVLLTGFMGTGKTAVGEALAKRLGESPLGYSFIDLDQNIVKSCGLTVSEIFAKKGEAFFRQEEKRQLQEALKTESVVIATGGGAVIDPENRRLMKRESVVVLLTAEPEVILERIGHLKGRPLLEGENKLATIQKLLAEREAFYGDATMTVDTSRNTIEETVQELLCQLAGR
ncbi:MAG: shikimate kinase [Deltaproteobacteria bacterium]|nr:shikimate kinase [Deltaproteobacteria bacterium]